MFINQIIIVVFVIKIFLRSTAMGRGDEHMQPGKMVNCTTHILYYLDYKIISLRDVFSRPQLTLIKYKPAGRLLISK